MKNATSRWTLPSEETPIRSTKEEHSNNEEAHQDRPSDLDSHSTAMRAPTLDALNIDFPKGKLIGVIGAVGAGKSSLLQVLLRELPLESGSITINGSISYASQEPWVFAASVRQNILFGQQFERDRYNAVVKTCALMRDFEQFENGDLTIVGERGTSLSGGQKARIKYVNISLKINNVFNVNSIS